MSDPVANVATPREIGTGPRGVVARWLRELELASKSEESWRKDAVNVIKRYRGESRMQGDAQTTRAESYNLLYSNVQTLGPILYNSTPEPVVERRFQDEDPLAKAAAEVLRRAIKYTVGCQDFDEVISLAVSDYQLPGRAVVCVQYVPTMAPTDDDDDTESDTGGPDAAKPRGEAPPPASASGAQSTTPADDPTQTKTDELVYEELRFDLTPWRSFRRGPGRTWQDVPWIAFELDLSKEKCVELFGKDVAAQLPMRQMRSDDDKNGGKEQIDREELFSRAKVWQIWDKNERKVYWVSPDYVEAPCKVSDDEYNLSGFFNIPRPLYAVETSDSLVPVPEFKLYEELANEAETIVNRMAKLVRAIRVRGGYDKNMAEIEKILESSETSLVPVSNADEWRDKGLANAVWMWPIEPLVEAYESLAQQLDRVKGEIFEILGIADIMRGATDPQETMGAQAMKVRWGSLRTRRRQSEVQRFCRDLFRIAGELIAEKFSPQTLAMMTGLQYPTAALKQQLQQAQATIQSNPQAAQGLDPEMVQKAQDMLSLPTWEDIVGFLRGNAMRHFRIDIQTDSTIALQDAEDQADYATMMKSVVELFGEISPLVQGGILPFDAAKAMLLGLTRKFRLGYDVEDKLAQMKQPPPQDPSQSPDAIKAAAKAEADKEVAQAKAQASIAIENARAQADVQINAHEAEMKAQLAAHKAQLDAQASAMKALPTVIAQVLIQHLKNAGAIDVARINAGVDAGEAMLAAETAAANREAAQVGVQ